MIVADPDTAGGERSKILDFGIAKLLDPQGQVGPGTCPDAVLGTPVYMSPEQCRGSAGIDDRADVYAFGVMLFWMLTGRPPYLGSLGDVIAQHMFADIPPLAELCPDAGPELGELCRCLLAKQPQLRPSMAEVATVLGQLEQQVSERNPQRTGSHPALSPTTSAQSSGTLWRIAAANQAIERIASPSMTPQGFSVKSAPQGRPGWKTALFLAGGALIMTAFALATQELSQWQRSPRPPALPIAAPAASPASRVLPAAAAPPTAPPPPLPPVIVRTTPPGALVFRAADHQLLGHTPWQPTLPLRAGEDDLLLHFPGYVEQRLHLPLDTAFEREIGLVKVPAAPAPREHQPGRSSPTPKKKVSRDEEKPPIVLEE